MKKITTILLALLINACSMSQLPQGYSKVTEQQQKMYDEMENASVSSNFDKASNTFKMTINNSENSYFILYDETTKKNFYTRDVSFKLDQYKRLVDTNKNYGLEAQATLSEQQNFETLRVSVGEDEFVKLVAKNAAGEEKNVNIVMLSLIPDKTKLTDVGNNLYTLDSQDTIRITYAPKK